MRRTGFAPAELVVGNPVGRYMVPLLLDPQTYLDHLPTEEGQQLLLGLEGAVAVPAP